VVVVVVAVDADTGEVLSEPEIVTHGWVYAPEAESLLEEARRRVTESLAEAPNGERPDMETLKRRVRKTVGRFVAERTKRRPMIVPVVVEA
jgi:ribonuclease J